MKEYIVFIEAYMLLLQIIIFLGSIIGIYFFKRLNFGYKILTFLLIYSFINEILCAISGKLFGNNLFFIISYFVIEFILIYGFLRTNNYSFKKIWDSIFLLLVGFNLYEIYSIDYQNFEMIQAYSISINCTFLLILSLIIIMKKLNNDEFNSSDKIYYALPCFLAMNALFHLPFNILINFIDIRVYLVWFANSLNITIFFSFIIYQIWKFGKAQKI